MTPSSSVLVVLVLAAACGDDGGSTNTTIDAGTTPTPPPVEALAACPPFVDATIMDSATSFIPAMTTVPLRGIVKFVMTAEHTVIPNTLVMTDGALMVGRGQTRCIQFNLAGTYGFACGVHGFAGTVTVQ